MLKFREQCGDTGKAQRGCEKEECSMPSCLGCKSNLADVIMSQVMDPVAGGSLDCPNWPNLITWALEGSEI